VATEGRAERGGRQTLFVRHSPEGPHAAAISGKQGDITMSTRTITLTGRPPVRIDDDLWPLIASASDNEHDGQVECQANRKSKWFVGVRQHEDGRTLVYATYSYDSHCQGERTFDARRGVMLRPAEDKSASNDELICAAIRDVCGDIATAEAAEGDASRWETLANDCIADMPAEDLA
jgi:hypothetical protein